MGTDQGDFRKAPRNLLQVDRSHSARCYILGLVEMFSQDDAGVKKDKPAIAIRQLVHRKVRRVVVRLLHEFQLTEAPETERVQLLHLWDHIRRVQIDEAEGNDLPGMLLGRFGDNPSVSKRDQKSTRLNSSHLVISYAVFCLKKKNK